MKITLTRVTLTNIVNFVTTLAAAVLPLLVEQGVVSTQFGAVAGGIVAALATGHHGTLVADNYAAKKPAVGAVK